MAGPASKASVRGDLLIFGGAAFLVIVGLGWWLSRGDRAPITSKGRSIRGDLRSMLVGDKACAECHPGEAALHARSGHARTFKLAEESRLASDLDGQSFPDPELPEVTWDYALRDGRLQVERREGETTETFTLEYALGSGGHATTFVSLVKGEEGAPLTGFEHHLTHFAHRDPPMGITPGQDRPAPLPGTVAQGRHLRAADVLVCFGCHTTLTSNEGKARIVPDQVLPNISCESCHAPGREHIDAIRSGARKRASAIDFGPGREKADTELRFCGQCHRHPEMAPPGSIRPDNREITRFQPVGLMQARCYKEAPGNLKCSKCHDPHAKASEDTKSYERICVSCHSGAGKTSCQVSPREACVSCHMPKADAGQGVLFTDHWIRRRKPIE